MIQNEVSILRRVKHPNIVLLIEEMDVPTELYLVMELVKVCVLEKRWPCIWHLTLLHDRALSLVSPQQYSVSLLCTGAAAKSLHTRIISPKFRSQPGPK